MRNAIRAVVAIAVIAAGGSVDARQNTIAGSWTLSIDHLPLKLVLSQKGRTISGMLDYPHGAPFQVTGASRGKMLTFSGDSAGQNFTVHIDATGSLNADGTLTGTLNAHFVDLDDAHQVVRTRDQKMPWTATRS